MTDSVFDEMKEVLALQKKAHIDEGPASYELRLDRLNRLSQMLKKYSDEIVDTISEDYGTRDKNSTFLSEVADHQFVLCPRGNAIDCHRNWEVLYMKRVPVMKRYPYLEELFRDWPVLFVDKYTDITEDLLLENEHLFQEAQVMSLIPLTLPTFFDNIVNTYAFGHV